MCKMFAFIFNQQTEVSAPVDDGTILRLVDLIESLDVFQMADLILGASPQTSTEKFGSAIVPFVPDDNLMPHRTADVRPDSPHKREFVQNVGAFPTSNPVTVSPAHFVAMLLLSWPYHQCSRNTYGMALRGRMLGMLDSVREEDGYEVLANETARLRQHLSLILNYTGQFRHCYVAGGSCQRQ